MRRLLHLPSLLLLILPLAAQDRPGIHIREHLAHRGDVIPYARIDSLAATLPPPLPRAVAPTHTIIGYLPYWQYGRYPDLDYNLLSQINFFGVDVNADGTLGDDHNWPASQLINFAHSRGVQVKLTAIAFGGAKLTTLLGSAANRQRAVSNLLAAVRNAGADGIDIDFEALPASQRDNMVAFMVALADSFRTRIPGAIITMAIPAVDWGNAWDINALAQIVDGLFIMAYDYHWSTGPEAGPVSPLSGTSPQNSWNVTRSVGEYLSKTGGNGSKLILGIPYYGYDWPVAGTVKYAATTGTGTARLYAAVVDDAATYGRQWDGASSSPWFNYASGGDRQVWYDDSLSLALKYQLATSSGLSGVGMWALGYDGDRSELWGALAEQFGPPGIPQRPSTWAVRSRGRGEAEISAAGKGITGYEFYTSLDGENFVFRGSNMGPQSTIPGLPADTLVYIRLAAVNDLGVSPLSEVLAVTTGPDRAQVLIVNGFDRTAGVNNSFDYIRRHAPHLARLGYALDAASSEAIWGGIVDLAHYQAVIWISGAEGVGTASFNGTEQQLLTAYLAGGGQLFVSGSEIGYDLVAAGTQVDSLFYAQTLKAVYLSDAAAGSEGPAGAFAFLPEAGTIFGGLPAINFDDGTQGSYAVRRADGIAPQTGATLLATYSGITTGTPSGAAISYAGSFGNSAAIGRLVYLAVGFETIYPASARDSLMARVANFFRIDTTGSDAILTYALGTIYPNPFRLSATIRIQLLAPGRAELMVYNILGREVQRLLSGPQEARSASYTFRPFDNRGMPLASGIYIVALTVDSGKPVTAKIIYRK